MQGVNSQTRPKSDAALKLIRDGVKEYGS